MKPEFEFRPKTGLRETGAAVKAAAKAVTASVTYKKSVTHVVTLGGGLLVQPGETVQVGSGELRAGPKPVPGTKCPTCGCRVPARASAAERKAAERARKKVGP